MSGTSMDGLDMCLADISLEDDYQFDYNIINTYYQKFDDKIINLIKNTINNNNYLDMLNESLGKKKQQR